MCIRDRATTDEMAMTNVTAAPMPTEVLTLLDTPKNGQMPKNCDRTTLLTKMEAMIMTKYSMTILVCV